MPHHFRTSLNREIRKKKLARFTVYPRSNMASSSYYAKYWPNSPNLSNGKVLLPSQSKPNQMPNHRVRELITASNQRIRYSLFVGGVCQSLSCTNCMKAAWESDADWTVGVLSLADVVDWLIWLAEVSHFHSKRLLMQCLQPGYSVITVIFSVLKKVVTLRNNTHRLQY